MPDVADPLPLLQSLGATSDEVAANLRTAGVKGQRGLHRSCPLAHYMQGQGFAAASVSPWAMEWGDCRRVLLPEACYFFVGHFDGGAYPDLEG